MHQHVAPVVHVGHGVAGGGPAQLGIQRVQLAQRVRAQAREHQITVHRQCPMPLGDQRLRVRHHVQGHRGLAAGFRSVDLYDSPLRHAAHAERDVKGERAGGNRLDVHGLMGFTQLHDRALAILLLQLADGGLQCLLFFIPQVCCGYCCFFQCVSPYTLLWYRSGRTLFEAELLSVNMCSYSITLHHFSGCVNLFLHPGRDCCRQCGCKKITIP